MYIILLFHSDGDITAVSYWNGAIKTFKQYPDAVRFTKKIKMKHKIVYVG